MSDIIIAIVNPSDYNFNRDTMPLYLFSFGAYGDTRVYAWGCHSLEDALEAAAEWLKDNAPGVFHEPDYAEAASEIGAPEDWDSDDNMDEWGARVQEAAEVDLTYTESGYFASWEWHVSEILDADEVASVRSRCVEEEEVE
jgi:hypothetical protein